MKCKLPKFFAQTVRLPKNPYATYGQVYVYTPDSSKAKCQAKLLKKKFPGHKFVTYDVWLKKYGSKLRR